MSLAESGHRSNWERPTRRDPAPNAKSISVVTGFSDTMRVGGWPIRTGSPKSSLTVATCERGCSHAASASAQTTRTRKDRRLKIKTDTPPRGMPATSTRQKKTPDRHQHLPRGSAKVARTKVVSWLRAAGLTFPTAPAVSGVYESALCPLQWRGRTGFEPVSVAPVRDQLFGEAIYVSAPAQAPAPSCPRSRA